jgi:hypothetical protein
MISPAGRQRHDLIAVRPFDPVILPGEGDAGLVGSQTSERRLLALQDGFGKAIVLPRLKVE